MRAGAGPSGPGRPCLGEPGTRVRTEGQPRRQSRIRSPGPEHGGASTGPQGDRSAEDGRPPQGRLRVGWGCARPGKPEAALSLSPRPKGQLRSRERARLLVSEERALASLSYFCFPRIGRMTPRCGRMGCDCGKSAVPLWVRFLPVRAGGLSELTKVLRGSSEWVGRTRPRGGSPGGRMRGSPFLSCWRPRAEPLGGAVSPPHPHPDSRLPGLREQALVLPRPWPCGGLLGTSWAWGGPRGRRIGTWAPGSPAATARLGCHACPSSFVPFQLGPQSSPGAFPSTHPQGSSEAQPGPMPWAPGPGPAPLFLSFPTPLRFFPFFPSFLSRIQLQKTLCAASQGPWWARAGSSQAMGEKEAPSEAEVGARGQEARARDEGSLCPVTIASCPSRQPPGSGPSPRDVGRVWAAGLKSEVEKQPMGTKPVCPGLQGGQGRGRGPPGGDADRSCGIGVEVGGGSSRRVRAWAEAPGRSEPAGWGPSRGGGVRSTARQGRARPAQASRGPGWCWVSDSSTLGPWLV